MGLLLTTHRLPERGNAPRVHNVEKADKRGVDFESFLKELVSKRLFKKKFFYPKATRDRNQNLKNKDFASKFSVGFVSILNQDDFFS